MKRLLAALFVLAAVLAGAVWALAAFWPDTKAGGYAVLVRDVAVESYGVTKDYWVEQWHKMRPPKEEPPAAAPVKEEKEIEPPKEPEPPKDPRPAADPSKPWKGLVGANWYCGKKLTEKALDGKIVMVYAFSEADEDSVALLPRIENVWSAYRTKPFIVLGSHRGGRSAKAEAAIRKAKVTFPVYEDAGRTKEPGSGGRYPLIYVVDDTGRMIYRGRSDLVATEAVVTAIPEVGKKRKR